MNDATDQQLLRDYAERQSEGAFAAIVQRYVDLVYSAARRMSCDAHAAKDVTQGVFVALAQNARQLTDRPALAGWLHGTARNLAVKAIRSDVRRRAREQEAAVMNELLSTQPDASWEHIAPHLDEALGELSEPDRNAVLLRYFKNRDLRTVGAALGISDDAAQKRVSRAVERLREYFAKRGVSVGASGLVAVVSANAIQAAPVGLAVSISATAVLAGSMLATTTTATQVTMNWINLKSIAAIAAAAITAGTGTFLVQERQTNRLREEQQNLIVQHEALVRERDLALSAAAARTDELNRLQQDKLELLRLRGEVGVLRRQGKELESLKTENVQLRAALAAKEQNLQPLASDSPEGRDTAVGIRKLNDAKQFVLGMHLYATDNADRFPDSFEVLVPYLGASDNPALTNLNQFEIVYSGAITNIPSPASTIVIREKEVTFLNGKWVKAYGFADGHSEIKSLPEEGFEAWEQRHMIPSSPPGER